MNVLDFLKQLDQADFKTNVISTLFRSFTMTYDGEELDDGVIISFLEKIPNEKFTEFGSKLGRCLADCKEEISNVGAIKDESYVKRLTLVQSIITDITTKYNNISSQRFKKQDNVSSTIAQHTDSLKEIKGKIALLNEDVKKANGLIDDKIFSLLINTVAILGIFVAISFTGFGVMSIFSNIDIKIAIASRVSFLKSIFFVLLVTLVTYNLLLLLTFFIYKLSRPIIISIKKDRASQKNDEQYVQSLKMTPFVIIDVLILVFTVIFFFVSVFS